MELLFLLLLIVVMIGALSSGFPVAFALPGAAVVTIGLAAAAGYIFAGDPSAYFVIDGPIQWLSAGVTNFRGIYWEVERDTLIAIPLFIFMGIMLQRSKIAEDLLVAMGRLFGPVPGGLGISVVFVGALLAATTGIVGATVVAMGLISLPAMLRNGYSKSLATGTICASGTLGQIIPPSIVLIILADQLASAADQAATIRQANYKAATGEFNMPADFAITSASAGDMFLGAFLPGLVLVGLYMAYILITALINPKSAPPVPYEGKYDGKFWGSIFLALIPPLALIFAVLGSIILGVATVNQAGAIGAVGAIVMAGYRLPAEGQKLRYIPAILAIGAIVAIAIVRGGNEINIKNLTAPGETTRAGLAMIAVIVMLIAVAWSAWRTLKLENTLFEVMVETAKTTSMVFIILIGAAMLTAAFRGFGGEELVREFLHGLPGGFWGQFLVVMLVIFVLGFFLDFIEIAVVVVPIVAPILLADPQANVTAVWLGVMIGMNIQTSFLTPPFGFALFYLRGVAPPDVRTTDIYKGASIFIGLQLVGLAIAGFFPPLVNYLPAKTALTSETAPPPVNPRLQQCLEPYVFEQLALNQAQVTAAANKAKALNLSYLPDNELSGWNKSVAGIEATYAKVDAVNQAVADIDAFTPDYADYHRATRALQLEAAELKAEIKDLKKTASSRYSTDADKAAAESRIAAAEARATEIESLIPADWKSRNGEFKKLKIAENRARMDYRRHVDNTYNGIADLSQKAGTVEALKSISAPLNDLERRLGRVTYDELEPEMQALESQIGEIYEASDIRNALAESRRSLKKDDLPKANAAMAESIATLNAMVDWRSKLLADRSALSEIEQMLAGNIGLRMQDKLSEPQAEAIASCMSHHKDLSLDF
ncbi:MAG: TRAP transporter large permease subunit [Gammaproteobacteria bacterium]|nr:TRAP transporter large permease subunit [Gammaproteobacteria bacterium]